MNIIDGHSHMYQTYAPSIKLKKTVKDIEGFDIDLLINQLNNIGVSQFQTMPQEMTRIRGEWLGSNELSADLQEQAPKKIIAYAAAEPLNPQDVFNKKRLEEVKISINDKKLKGLLLTPPYGHYYSNDRRVYPFYEMAVEFDIPIYFHHSHQFGLPNHCPLKYAKIELLDDLVIDFPELRFNAEHMGYPWTEELLSIMARSPNVYTDIAMYIEPLLGKARHLMLARNLNMAREYGVIDRVFYGSDYVGENINEYIDLLKKEIFYIKDKLNNDLIKLGYEPLTRSEIDGLLTNNVQKLWKKII